MDDMIYPEVFDGRVMGFFTGRELGISVGPIVGRKIYMPLQKHTSEVIVLGADTTPKIADAVITDRKDIIVGVQVADCVPILLYDVRRRVIAAVHAGWRGTAKGVLKNTIGAMKSKFKSRPSDILMASGPAIRWCCYEVGKEVLDAVIRQTGEGRYYSMQNGRKGQKGTPCLDLPSANRQQAISAGIPEKQIWTADECTYCLPEMFHSYRYSGAYTGKQGGFIGLP